MTKKELANLFNDAKKVALGCPEDSEYTDEIFSDWITKKVKRFTNKNGKISSEQMFCIALMTSIEYANDLVYHVLSKTLVNED